MSVGAIGGGAFGTSLCVHCARAGHATLIYTRDAATAADINDPAVKENKVYFKGGPSMSSMMHALHALRAASAQPRAQVARRGTGCRTACARRRTSWRSSRTRTCCCSACRRPTSRPPWRRSATTCGPSRRAPPSGPRPLRCSGSAPMLLRQRTCGRRKEGSGGGAGAQVLVSCTKGILNDTLETVDKILERVLPASFHRRLAFLSGPSFAAEARPARRPPAARPRAAARRC